MPERSWSAFGRWWRRWMDPTTPARLRRLLAVTVAGCVALAGVSAFGGRARATSAAEATDRIEQLALGSAELYRALARADVIATTVHLAASQSPASLRHRYDQAVRTATTRLSGTASRVPTGDPMARPLAAVVTRLPVYTGLIETAWTYSRTGLTLGSAYLHQASRLMRSELLPAAEQLRRAAAAQLLAAYGRAGSPPVWPLAAGLGLLAALIDGSWQEWQRTNRLLNPGLLASGALVLATVVWWAVVWALTAAALHDARSHVRSLTALDDVRIVVLQARSEENLSLLGLGRTDQDQDFESLVARLVGEPEPERGGAVDLLDNVAATGLDIGPSEAALGAWLNSHERLGSLLAANRYGDAVAWTSGTTPESSGITFGQLDTALTTLATAEREQLAAAADRAARPQRWLTVGPCALALAAAATASAGLAQRLWEYR